LEDLGVDGRKWGYGLDMPGLREGLMTVTCKIADDPLGPLKYGKFGYRILVRKSEEIIWKIGE
jgi:hypothetical protein